MGWVIIVVVVLVLRYLQGKNRENEELARLDGISGRVMT